MRLKNKICRQKESLICCTWIIIQAFDSRLGQPEESSLLSHGEIKKCSSITPKIDRFPEM